MTIIGLDFGNYNSYTSFIQDLDYESGRLGGRAASLMPAGEYREGIPSVFYYDRNSGETLVCQAAERARPLTNQVRYLKRGLFKPLEINGKQVQIQGKVWLYDDAIRMVIQDVLRQANEVLFTNYRQTTNLVSLAYPVTYSPPQVEELIKIVESTTVKLRRPDGSEQEEKVRVFGTIPEAPAAALDYLADQENDRKKDSVTVATFDLGGGTFDAAVVRCYPQGKKRTTDGSVYYYDLLWQDGISDLGGKEFTEVIAEIAEKKLKSQHVIISEMQRERLHQVRAESAKRDLTLRQRTEIEAKDDIFIEISLSEFENASQPYVQRMVDVLGQAMRSKEFRPDLVLLSGGASQMPMIKKALEKAFPEWKDKIHAYRPLEAISFGAARYGVTEFLGASSVQKRSAFDLGLECTHAENGKDYIFTMINEGTPIPCSSDWQKNLWTVATVSTNVSTNIWEAVVHSPEINEVQRDYRKIINCSLPFGREVPSGTRIQCRLSIDNRGVMTIESREKEEDIPVKASGIPTLK